MNQPVDGGLQAIARAGLDGIALTVNGQAAHLDCSPSTRLAHALREDLGLTGTKIGCDAGDCGACTVLLDGKQVCACITAVAQCAGREVTTVEGLAVDGSPGILQQAFLKHGAAQCGICTPGMLMAAAGLLARNAQPTESEVIDALGGVLCRCTGYRKIVEAVLAVAVGDVVTEAPVAGQAVGSRLARIDGVAKITGAEKYGADFAPPGCRWLRVVRSPHPRATFSLGDLAAFRARYPQVEGIITARDVPENSFAVFPVPKDQPVLADGHVRFRGEAVLGLIGEREAILAIPESAVPITWEPQAALLEPEQALTATGDLIHDFAPENVLCRGRVVKGDVANALRGAAFTAEGEFRTSYVEHAYIEPEAGYAEVFNEGGRERLRVFACTQTPYMDRDEIALILGLALDQVRIIPTAVGGGFGGKLDLSVQPLIAIAAWLTRRPVRWVYTRRESMAATTKRHPARITARASADAEGRLVSFIFHGDYDTGAYASWGPTVANRVPIHATGPYAIPNVAATSTAHHTTNPPSGAFRGFGVPQSAIATEALMDLLADQLGHDRLAFRRRNALGVGSHTATGQTLGEGAALPACLDALAPHWTRLRAEDAVFNATAPHLRRGTGIACMWYGIGNTAMSNPSEIHIGITSDGAPVLFSGAVDIGQGSNTVMAQIAAEALGIDPAALTLITGDTDRTPDAGKTSASRQTFVSGNAARAAALALRADILRRANAGDGATLHFAFRAIHVHDGTIETIIDLAPLPQDADGCVLRGSGRYDPPTTPLDANGQGSPYASYAFGAQIAQVEVDLAFGTTTVRHIIAAHDVGRAINPTLVIGQIHGGIAQGIGLALMEEYIPGRTDNLHDYLIPTIGDVPPITTILIEQPDPHGPHGAKGVGEPALIATAPAILNAIADATGARLTQIPATPARLLAAIEALK